MHRDDDNLEFVEISDTFLFSPLGTEKSLSRGKVHTTIIDTYTRTFETQQQNDFQYTGLSKGKTQNEEGATNQKEE